PRPGGTARTNAGGISGVAGGVRPRFPAVKDNPASVHATGGLGGLITDTLAKGGGLVDGRIHVWGQRFKDRAHLMLQWLDPETGRRKSKSAETADEKKAEQARADLEADLNNGRYAEASRISWERFRELFEEEYVAPLRPDTRKNYEATLDLFERLCHLGSLRSISERTVSQFATLMRKEPGRAKGSTG